MSKDRDKGKTVTICGGNKTYDGTKCIVKSTSSYPSSTSNGGGGNKGSYGNYSGSNSGQNKINPQVAKQITDKINASESAIQNEIGRLKGLNPIASEETLRSAAIQFLGIATVESQRELEVYNQNIVSTNNSQQHIPSDLIPYFASHSGKVIGWLEHQNNTLNLNFNIAGKDLDMSNKQITDENMLFFCQKMASFTFHFDNLIISNNLMTNLSVQYLFNATLTSPTNRTIKNLDLRNNQIGDVGAELIAAYLKHGYMPATTHVNLADNIITDKGALCFAESLNSSVNKLKVIHLEGNKITKTGEGFLVRALKQISQDIMVTLEKYSANLGQKVIKPILKDFVKYAEKNGVDTTHIATNKNVFEYMKDISIMKDNFFIGLFKCKTRLDYLESGITEKDVAVEVMVKMIGKKFTPLDTLVCIYESSNETFVTPEGVDLTIKFIDLIGDSE